MAVNHQQKYKRQKIAAYPKYEPFRLDKIIAIFFADRRFAPATVNQIDELLQRAASASLQIVFFPR
ncbi:hypothetical protein [Pantoea sp. KPR_PJ]|uniref:hypothetical protein n=1 Tax=Pantoea sp. KPR_PJ TaxID=2738375 RepID=UPI003528132B